MKSFLTLIGLLFVLQTHAQVKSEDAMEKLKPLVGNWEGKAKSTTGPNQTILLDQSEVIEYRLDDRLLLIEGKGYKEGNLEFNALASIWFDEEKQIYEMQSWLKTGEVTKAYFREIEKNNWEWGFDISQGQIRYNILIVEKDQWVEKGEFSPDGERWFPTFEMTLNRK